MRHSRLPGWIPALFPLSFICSVASAQQHIDVSALPMIEGPGTQGFVVYRGAPTPNSFWFCEQIGTNFTSVGEVAEEMHMLQGGDLASITFAYHVQGNATITSGTASAVIKVYANDPADGIVPPAGHQATYTKSGLPWSTTTNHTATFDIPTPFPVTEDLWIGIEIVSPAGTAGSVMFGRSPSPLPVVSPAPAIGSSHDVTWFGPACPPDGLFHNSTDFGFVANYTILVRVFPPAFCPDAITNGDFETGALAPWGGTGRRGVLTADLIPVAGNTFYTVPPSGAYQGFVSNGGVYSGTGTAMGTSSLETALGVPAGTLLALGGGAATQGSCLTQVLTVSVGDKLEFMWNFQTNEAAPAPTRNDFAFLTISTNGALLLADTLDPTLGPSTSPFARETGYRNYQYVFGSSGTVTIGFGVADRGTSTTDSALLIDCVEHVLGTPANNPPSCSADLSLAENDFLQGAPGAFVVTEGETLVVPFHGADVDGDLLQVSTSGFPAGAAVLPLSGNAPLMSTLTWTPSAADKAGAPYTLSVTFTDPAGASSSCEVTVADVNLRPVCTASDQTVECTSHAGALVTLDGSATDADDPPTSLSYQWFVSDASVALDDPSARIATGLFPIGVTMATLTVVDGRGGVDVCDVLITVQDTLPPELQCTTDRASLWPPKHSMVPVTLVILATDECDDPDEILPISVRVSSSEPDDALGSGDGSTTGDVGGFDGYAATVDATDSFEYDPGTGLWTGTILLRAERAGAGVGRKYTIDVQAFDSHGNEAIASCCVVVPHDQRARAL